MSRGIRAIEEYLPRVAPEWRMTWDKRRDDPEAVNRQRPPEQVFDALAASVEALRSNPYRREDRPDLGPGPWDRFNEEPWANLLSTIDDALPTLADVTRERIEPVVRKFVRDPSEALIDFVCDHFVAFAFMEIAAECSNWFGDHLHFQPDHPVSKAILDLATETWAKHHDPPALVLLSAAADTSATLARPLLEQALREYPDPRIQRELRWKLACIEGYYENPPPPGTSRFIG